jgi:hypothetical protein
MEPISKDGELLPYCRLELWLREALPPANRDQWSHVRLANQVATGGANTLLGLSLWPMYCKAS